MKYLIEFKKDDLFTIEQMDSMIGMYEKLVQPAALQLAKEYKERELRENTLINTILQFLPSQAREEMVRKSLNTLEENGIREQAKDSQILAKLRLMRNKIAAGKEYNPEKGYVVMATPVPSTEPDQVARQLVIYPFDESFTSFIKAMDTLMQIDGIRSLIKMSSYVPELDQFAPVAATEEHLYFIIKQL